MKAAVVRRFKEPVAIEDVPKPEPGEGEVLVKIEACGLCRTDIHAAHGDWPVKPKLPLVPGHEGVGIVEGVGRGVTALSEGDRVAVPWLGHACSGVDPLDAGPLSCAGVATYKAVKISDVRPSHLVAVFGIGGLGHLAVQYGKISGASLVAVSRRDDKLAMARELGADYTVNASERDPVEEIKKLGGADVAISAAHTAKAFEQAYRSLRRGGTLVFVGLPAENYVQLPIFETVLNGITIRGSIVRHERGPQGGV
jgi:alcohol dehydrogenase, propanol-preferring